jgi:hypothetical protein
MTDPIADVIAQAVIELHNAGHGDLADKLESLAQAPDTPQGGDVDLCEVARELERVHASHVISDVEAIADGRTNAYWCGFSMACSEIAHRLGLAQAPDAVSDVTDGLIEQLRSRDATGLAKYGTTLDRADLTAEQWLQHLTEELLDGAGYAQAATREIRKQAPDAGSAGRDARIAELEAELSAKDEAYRLQFEACASIGARNAKLVERAAAEFARRYWGAQESPYLQAIVRESFNAALRTGAAP